MAADVTIPRTTQDGHADPRDFDLTEDSVLWVRLLDLAYDADGALFQALWGMRCCGLRLRKGQASYVLRPLIDPSGRDGWYWDSRDYERDRDAWLVPRKELITKLLGALDEPVPASLPRRERVRL